MKNEEWRMKNEERRMKEERPVFHSCCSSFLVLRSSFFILFIPCSLLLTSCSNTGEFTLFGYTTASQYSRDIRTIRVPIFKNKTFVRGIEFELTEAVVKQIEAKSHWKVVDSCEADTELLGTIIAVPKRVILQNPLNEVRDAELSIAVELIWRDLRTGQIISNAPSPRVPGLTPSRLTPADPLAPPATPAGPVLVQQSVNFIPELGQSNASARKELVDDLAEQIVSAMEVPW